MTATVAPANPEIRRRRAASPRRWRVALLFATIAMSGSVLPASADGSAATSAQRAVSPCASYLTQRSTPGELAELVRQLGLGRESTAQMLRHFRVGTLNLMNWRKGRWNKRKERVARSILQEGPYVLANQEIEGPEAYAELASALGGAYVPVMVEGNKPSQHVGFLVRTDLGLERRFASHRDEQFEPVPGEDRIPIFNRDFPVLDFRDPETGKIVLEFGGVHLKSRVLRDNQPDPVERRARQSERSVEILNSRWGGTERAPQLAGGDFQGAPTRDPEYRAFPAAGFEDVFAAVGLPLEDRATHLYFPEQGAPIRGQLDAILFRGLPASAVLGAYVHRVTDRRGQELPLAQSYFERRDQGSDHELAMAILDLSGTPGP